MAITLERRQFLKSMSLTSLGLLPGINVLAGLISPEDYPGGKTDTKFVDYACRLMHPESLLYLEFYFLNVFYSPTKKALLPLRWDDKDEDRNAISERQDDKQDRKRPRSYMVVRLPQQHITEEFYSLSTLKAKAGAKVYAMTAISGYSFLVFEFQKKLLLKPQVLMNWNAPYFNLVVKEAPEQSLFDIQRNRAYYERDHPYVNDYPLGYKGAGFDRNNFPKYDYGRFSKEESLVKEKEEYYLTDKYLFSDPGPATAIEAPYRLILSPKLPDSHAYRFYWSFSLPSQKKDSHTTTELWMATLRVSKRRNVQKAIIARDSKAETELRKENEGDNLMELMIIGSPDYPRTRENDESQCAFKKLPCGLDRKELTELYMRARIGARTPAMSFTPLGLSAYINLRNSSYEKNGISLYQWDHQISFGRDQQVTVSRIVVDSLHGCKMLHIQSTNRETYNEQSVLVYREFLMPLDLEKDFSLYDNNSNISAYHQPNWKFRSCFKRSRFQDPRPVEIRPISEMSPDRVVFAPQTEDEKRTGCDCQNQIDGQKIVAFRPVTLDGRDLYWEMRTDDWHDEDELKEEKTTEPAVKKGTRYDVDLFMLSSDLAKNPDFEMLYQKGSEKISFSKLYEDKFTSLDVSQPFATVRKVLEEKITDIKNDAVSKVWTDILDRAQDFKLQKTDLYRDYLERKINQVEENLRSQAASLADEVMEDWYAFKRRALQAEGDILSIYDRLILEVRRVVDELPSTAAALSSFPAVSQLTAGEVDIIRKLLTDFEADINRFKGEILNDIDHDFRAALTKIQIYRDTLVSRITRFVNEITNTANLAILRKLYSSYRDRIAIFQGYLDTLKKIEGAVESLGIEYAFRVLMEELPKGFARRIRNVLHGEVSQIRECFHSLQHVEETLLGKARFYKAKLGYAVSQVEEELAELKKKLERENPLNKKKWQEEYEALRRKYHQEVNKPVSALQTEYVVFRNNFRHFEKDFKDQLNSTVKDVRRVFDFYHENACFPQVHNAKVFVDTVTDLVQKEIPVHIRYAEDYFKNQVRDTILDTQNNAARVFAEIKADSRELIKGAVRSIGKEMGGLVNPELAADFLTFAKDIKATAEEAKQQLQDIENVLKSAKDQVDEAINKKIDDLRAEADGLVKDGRRFVNDQLNASGVKEYLNQAKNSLVLLSRDAKQALITKENEAKAYFNQLEAKILGAIHLKDIIGDKSMLPRLDRKNNKITYTFITNKLISPPRNPVFSFQAKASTNLVLHMEKPLKNARDYVAWTRLNDFAVGIFDERVIIHFQQLQIYSDNQTKNKVSVRIQDVKFQKELAFIEALAKNIKLPGTGLSLSVRPTEISVDFAYLLPGISGGAFNFFNVKFHIGVIIPFPIGGGASRPIRTQFGINTPDDKFVLGVGIWGGRGHAVVEATPKHISKVDVGMDYGGLLALSLGIAQGQAFLMAGIRYVFERDTEFGYSKMELYAIVTCGGSVTVFGFITISVVFLLGLKYENRPGASTLHGICSVTYSVEIGFFKKSFTLSFSKRLYGSDNSAASREDYGYRRDPQSELQATHAIWRESEQEPRQQYRFAGSPDKPKVIEDEYTWGKKPLEERYTSKEWRRMCTLYKFDFL